MKRWNAVLAALAVLLILGGSIRGAMAYFTTYVVAEGGYEIRFGSDVTLTEEVAAWIKRLVVSNTPGSEPIFVRAKALCGSEYQLLYEAPSGKWTAGDDGYYYYEDILYGGESAEVLNIHIGTVPEDPAHGDGFHVVVVYETTPVLYHEDGTPYADWDNALTVVPEGGNTP